MYEGFGAHATDKTADDANIEFKLFLPDSQVAAGQYHRGGLPHIRSVRVVGTFQAQPWDVWSAPQMTRQQHAKGWLWSYPIPGKVAKGYHEYKYLVQFDDGRARYCTDPCAKYGGKGEQNAGFAVGGHDLTLQWMTQRPAMDELVIYELMIDDFTSGYCHGGEAPLDAVRRKLDHVQSLGANAICFMPWVAWPGDDFSWGYNPFMYFAVEHRYTHDPEAQFDRLYRLKQLIGACHDRGMAVIMDAVLNHVETGPDGYGFPYYWLYKDPDDSPYIGRFGEAGFFRDLDFSNRCTAEFIADVCKYWIDEFKIDGIRYDYVRGIYSSGVPSLGLPALIAELDAHIETTNGPKGFLHILEHLTDNRYDAINDTNNLAGATHCWYDPLMHQCWGALRGSPQPQMMRALDAARDYASAKAPVTYIENHDHSTITCVGGGSRQWFRSQPAAIALFTTPGAVMIHNGQEFGQAECLFESDSGLPWEKRRVRPRPVDWSLAGTDEGRLLQGLYTRLAEMRGQHPALRGSGFYPREYHDDWKHLEADGYGVDVDKRVCIYHRWYTDDHCNLIERFTIVLSFSGEEQKVDIPFAACGKWKDLLCGKEVEVHLVDGRPQLRGHGVPSNWGYVFWRGS